MALLYALGMIAALGYWLQRLRFLTLKLHRWVPIGLVAIIALSAWRGWQRGFGWPETVAIAICSVMLALLSMARARRFVVFRRCDNPAVSDVKELATEEKAFMRATGYFEVGGKRRYLVEAPAVFWTTEMDEHIVAAKVTGVNLLGVLHSPLDEVGWWYLFLVPRTVRSISAGRLYFGFGARPAIEVRFQGQKAEESLVLSFNDSSVQKRLLRELQARAGL
ncbi:MAG: hypothetical protein H5T64_01770 [Chloroflexi bacterium]|nr:hypothetical protein [Chloroflexota bacterium]